MPLRFTLRQLEYLVAVGDCGSIVLAAERVNVSSPSISTAIAQLEQELGLQLFVRRHAQGLSLTDAGRRMVAEARGVLAAAGRMTDLASEITGSLRGPLTVGCLQTVAQVLLQFFGKVPRHRLCAGRRAPGRSVRRAAVRQGGPCADL
jgi:DNA-binding transcriptional LysR family regulator